MQLRTPRVNSAAELELNHHPPESKLDALAQRPYNR